jgi:hypothetical protein
MVSSRTISAGIVFQGMIACMNLRVAHLLVRSGRLVAAQEPRHLPFAVGVLLLSLGCPSEYGRAGRVDQAMGDDLRQSAQACPAGKHPLAPTDSCLGDSCEPTCVDDGPDAGP